MSTNTAFWGAEKTQASGLLARIADLPQSLARARAKRRTQIALADLDDHVLRDIGLNPSEMRRTQRAVTDWVLQSHSGTARLVFIGR